MPENTYPKTTLTDRLEFFKGPLIAFITALVLYGAVSGDRLATNSRDNHYVYLADAMLHGRLHLDGAPPSRNDWARYDNKWFVSFPPLPAILMIPGVAISGLKYNDRIFSLFFAALGPALLLLLLQMMVARARLNRKLHNLWMLAILYGFGTVYFFSAVQGSVWFTAHMVGSTMLLLYMIFALDGRRPILAGLFLGLAFACRPPMLLAFPFFIYEILRQYEPANAAGPINWVRASLKSMGLRRAITKAALFGTPILLVISALMLMNEARFDDPFEFGHRFLQVKQTARIAKWGLFNYHYLGHNLAVVLTSLPWFIGKEPYVYVSLHGLAIWVTTPVFFFLLWPKDKSRMYMLTAFTALLIALPSLLYQNSGWVQFGYRFSLDFTPMLMVMLAIGGRKFGKLFIATLAMSIIINLFGAVTFDREWKYYAGGRNKDRIHQPN